MDFCRDWGVGRTWRKDRLGREVDKGFSSGYVEFKTPKRDPGGDRKWAVGRPRLRFGENGEPGLTLKSGEQGVSLGRVCVHACSMHTYMRTAGSRACVSQQMVDRT